MISKATWKEKISLITKLFWSYFFSHVNIIYWDLIIFKFLCLFRGNLFNMCLFRSFLFNMCLFKGFLLYLCPLVAIDLSILDWSIILMPLSKVPSFPYVFIFRRVTSFESTGLSHFRRILDSFVNHPTRTSIHVEVFATKICDFITFFLLMNASGNWFARFYKWMILWTFNSHWFIRWSRWDIIDAFGIDFSPHDDGEILSLK